MLFFRCMVCSIRTVGFFAGSYFASTGAPFSLDMRLPFDMHDERLFRYYFPRLVIFVLFIHII